MENERRSLKEVVKANKTKILMGGMFIVGFASCYTLDCKFNMKKNNERISTLYEAASEGLFEEAIATCTRKLNTRMDIICRLEKLENLDQQCIDKLMKAKIESGIFRERIDKFTEAQKLWGIED